ncbi:GNAT family N-acetyltransferase [Altererythrobacter litoralis]|uniref:GNAT family N-acetyltransferase n=1 Tax=Altererythrobacter litoralis TaxID=3113904 RepID=A0ABU7GDU8_9SPHN|nr:GNAT family N-acetyltransferase [Erythrobacteraceae bacterium 1XM1-14]
MTTRLATSTLESERFILRPVVREDTPALFPTMSDPEQCRYLLDPAFTDPETLADWLCDTEWDGRSWSAIDRESGEVAARVVAMPRGERIAEVG